jgi:hypothetical protein
MTTVFVVQHAHEIDDQSDVKLIGVYSSEPRAREAIERFSATPGFCAGQFTIDSYDLDVDHWNEGFVSLTTLYVQLEDEGTDVWRPVQAVIIDDNRYRLLGPMPPDERWSIPPNSIVQSVEKNLSGGVHNVAVEVKAPSHG